MNVLSVAIAGLVAGIAAMGTVTAAAAASISGAGATFPYPLYARWAAEYRSETGNTVNYQSIGSGGGIKQIQQRTVAFGASDKPLSAAELRQWGLLQFPTVIGGVVPVVNIRGIAPGQLALDGSTLANIFLGRIKKWNDPALRRLNPRLPLPDQFVAPIYRSDGSGTTFIFTDYLGKVSRTFADEVGAGTSVSWPIGLGAKGNEGVAANVKQTVGSIGYVEYAYAKQNRMTHVRLWNRGRKYVQPTLASFQAAASAAQWNPSEGFGTILTDQAGAESWPIAGATFVLVHRQPSNPAATIEALKFFHWSFRKGDAGATELGYVPLPDNVTGPIEATWPQVKGWQPLQ